MRFLVVVCVLLVLSNVVIYLWPDKANYAPHAHIEKTDVNPNYLRLNKEIEDKFYNRPVISDAESVVVNIAGGKKSEGNQSINCYRVGPFLHEVNYELAQAVLYNASVDYKAAKRESKESSVYRVYLGPFDSQAAASDIRTDLRRKKILDHFVRKNEQGEYLVSLGIYTTKESVLDAVSLFEATLEGVKYANELVLLPESYWLYFALEEENPIREQLFQVDWGERAAKMGKFQCQA